MSPEELAALCAAAMPHEQLTADDLLTCCYGPDSQVIGDTDAAAAWLWRDFGGVKVGWLLLIAVAPGARRGGRGRRLVEEIVATCREVGVTELHTGNCAPRYVWPGVDLSGRCGEV